MNAFIAGLIAELNADAAGDIVEFSHVNAYRKVVVRRVSTGNLYTYVKDIRGNFIFIPV